MIPSAQATSLDGPAFRQAVVAEAVQAQPLGADELASLFHRFGSKFRTGSDEMRAFAERTLGCESGCRIGARGGFR